jgi:hypothetical protein
MKYRSTSVTCGEKIIKGHLEETLGAFLYARAFRREDGMNHRIRVLVSINPKSGLVAHLLTSDDFPLCKLRLKRSVWQIREVYRETVIICGICRLIEAKQA